MPDDLDPDRDLLREPVDQTELLAWVDTITELLPIGSPSNSQQALMHYISTIERQAYARGLAARTPETEPAGDWTYQLSIFRPDEELAVAITLTNEHAAAIHSALRPNPEDPHWLAGEYIVPDVLIGAVDLHPIWPRHRLSTKRRTCRSE